MLKQTPGTNRTMTNVQKCRTLDVSKSEEGFEFRGLRVVRQELPGSGVQEKKLLTQKIHGGLADFGQAVECIGLVAKTHPNYFRRPHHHERSYAAAERFVISGRQVRRRPFRRRYAVVQQRRSGSGRGGKRLRVAERLRAASTIRTVRTRPPTAWPT